MHYGKIVLRRNFYFKKNFYGEVQKTHATYNSSFNSHSAYLTQAKPQKGANIHGSLHRPNNQLPARPPVNHSQTRLVTGIGERGREKLTLRDNRKQTIKLRLASGPAPHKNMVPQWLELVVFNHPIPGATKGSESNTNKEEMRPQLRTGTGSYWVRGNAATSPSRALGYRKSQLHACLS